MLHLGRRSVLPTVEQEHGLFAARSLLAAFHCCHFTVRTMSRERLELDDTTTLGEPVVEMELNR